MNKFICIVFLLLSCSKVICNNTHFITNIARDDGFGAQYQSIIYAIIYAELNNKEFVYTPFQSMAHNYVNDPSFLKKKEALINILDSYPINRGQCIQLSYSDQTHHHFFENNLKLCTQSKSLKKIKTLFFQNKNKASFLPNTSFNIAVHIRRPNPHDTRIEGSDIPDQTYLRIINSLRRKYKRKSPLFHIYSQGDINIFKEVYAAKDTILHINEPLESTFCSMVFANVLVTTASSLSYVAGIISNGEIYYIPFWHPPLPGWHVIKNI